MSWGAYWMYYRCPACGSKYRWDLNALSNPEFGRCPDCGAEGESKALPPDPDSYPDCTET